MNYQELCADCAKHAADAGCLPANDPHLIKVTLAWQKFCNGTDPSSLDEVADKVARELKLGEYTPFLPEPTEYEGILASQELMK
jgi:hypothetical protein